MFLRRRQEDETAKVSNVFRVIWKIRIQLKVKVNVQILSADYAKAICVFLLIQYEQAWAILLPICAINVDEHFDSIDEENDALVFLKPAL